MCRGSLVRVKILTLGHLQKGVSDMKILLSFLCLCCLLSCKRQEDLPNLAQAPVDRTPPITFEEARSEIAAMRKNNAAATPGLTKPHG